MEPHRSSAPNRQALNAVDRLMLVGHKALRSVGHGGFQCQAHAWCRGRIDANRLARAIRRLHGYYPIVTARLDEPGRRGVPHWMLRPDAVPVLNEAQATSAEDRAVQAFGERLFASPMDLDRVDPITFHLLHLPDGRDVFMLHFSHVLMDGKAPEYVLFELSRCYDEANDSAPPPAPLEPTGVDDLAAHLFRFPFKRRFKAGLSVIRSHIRLPERPIVMTPPDKMDWICEPYGIAVRHLSDEDTERVIARSKRICGFQNLTPLILASAFRAVARLSAHPQSETSLFQTDVPLNLRAPGRMSPIFRNFMSFVSMEIRRRDLRDREEASRHLYTHLRSQISRSMDLGNEQLMSALAPSASLMERHIRSRAKKMPSTFGFGFLGPIIAGLERFCGQETEMIYTVNSALSPPGITLQVNQYRGRLNAMITYIVGPVSRAVADEFLDLFVDDLRRDDPPQLAGKG